MRFVSVCHSLRSLSLSHTDAKNMDAELKLAVRVGQDARFTDTGTF